MFFFIIQNFYKPWLGYLQSDSIVSINGKQFHNSKALYSPTELKIISNGEAKLEKSSQYSISFSNQSEVNISKQEKTIVMDYKQGYSLFDIYKPNLFLIKTFNSLVIITGTKFILIVDPKKEDLQKFKCSKVKY